MEQVRKKNIKLLILCLLNIIILSIGHSYDNQMLLFGSLLLFTGITLIANKKYFLPIMLFYLPWSPVLKTGPESFTFFTLVVPCVLVLITWRFFKKELYRIQYLFLLFFFIGYTLLVKLFNGFSFDMSYLFFIMMLIFIPVYISIYKQEIDFETCVLYLTTGVLSACISAKTLMNFPHMLAYIDVYKWEDIGLTRLSGFYGDANFYSVNIIVAIASLLIVLYKTRTSMLITLQIISILALLYYGMLSVSKMFLLCIAGIIALWIFSLVVAKRNIFYKFGVAITILIVSGIAVANHLFTEEFNLYLKRFTMISDAQSLTTGRTDLYDMYIHYLFSNGDRLFFGEGLTSKLLNGKSSHNTLIQIIYQVGIIGSGFFIVWWGMVGSILSNKVKLGPSEILNLSILIFACILPWLVLDMLYFDEFFYLTLLIILARNYLTPNSDNVTSAEIIAHRN